MNAIQLHLNKKQINLVWTQFYGLRLINKLNGNMCQMQT